MKIGFIGAGVVAQRVDLPAREGSKDAERG
jgi:hypothetical protein